MRQVCLDGVDEGRRSSGLGVGPVQWTYVSERGRWRKQSKKKRAQRKDREGTHPRDDLILLPQGVFIEGERWVGVCSGSSHTLKSTENWGVCQPGAVGGLRTALEERDGCR